MRGAGCGMQDAGWGKTALPRPPHPRIPLPVTRGAGRVGLLLSRPRRSPRPMPESSSPRTTSWRGPPHPGTQPEESENGTRRFPVEAAEIAESTPEHNRQNEPTDAISDHQNLTERTHDPIERPPNLTERTHRRDDRSPRNAERTRCSRSVAPGSLCSFSSLLALLLCDLSDLDCEKRIGDAASLRRGFRDRSPRNYPGTGLLCGEKTIIVKHWLDAPARREPKLSMSKMWLMGRDR